MEDILKQILDRLDNMEKEQKEMRQEQKEMRQEITEARQNAMLFEDRTDRAIKGLQETQTMALDMIEQSRDLLQETKDLVDDKLTTAVAVEAKIIDFERRITALEHAV